MLQLINLNDPKQNYFSKILLHVHITISNYGGQMSSNDIFPSIITK